MKPIPTAKSHYTQFWTGWANAPKEIIESETEDELIERSHIEFAKLHVEAALKEASQSRCIKMFDNTWYAQSLSPGTTILDTVNITVDKDTVLNAYPLSNIK